METMNNVPKNAVATAHYNDPYFGWITAHLVTFRTTRKLYERHHPASGGRCISYRWQSERGGPLMKSMLTPNALLNRAASHAQFEHVAALLSAREHFIPATKR
jgi:hypothetical protein